LIPAARLHALTVAICLLPASQLAAQDVAPTAPSDVQVALNRIPGLFEIDLPATEIRGNVRLNFQPSFRDLIDKAYLRIPFEFRWGVNDHFELNSAIETYVDHGLRQTRSGSGMSELHFGAKYAWTDWLKPTWNVSAGFNSSIPVDHPPLDLTDGHNHLTPYLVFGRKLGWKPGLSGFVQTSADFLSRSSTPGAFGRNEPHSNSLTLTPGLLYDHRDWHYTLEVDGTTTSLVGKRDHNFLTIRPGVIWELPRWLVSQGSSRWFAGFSVAEVFGPDGTEFSTGGRFRGEFNFTRLFGGNQP
ncbi:MAG: hypothetical protein ACHQ5A_01730, partial [Opitutales bacterium]